MSMFLPQMPKSYRPPMLGLGFLGAVRPTVYPALSTITWTNDSLPNSFSVTNEELHTKIVTYLNMHLPILPGSLTVNISTNWSFASQTVTISFAIFQDTAEDEVRFGVLQAVDIAYGLSGVGQASGDWGTFTYEVPPPGSGQTASTLPDVVSPSGSPVARTPASKAGILSAGAFPDGTTYVSLSDGNTINFDNQGDPLFGIPYGAYSVAFAIAYDDGTVGVVMTDGTEYLFSASGSQILPAASGSGSSTANLSNAVYNQLHQIGQNVGLNKQPQPKTSTSETLLDMLGLSNAPLALGVTSGVVLAGLGIAAYLVLSKK